MTKIEIQGKSITHEVKVRRYNNSAGIRVTKLSITLPKELASKVDEIAREHGQSRSFAIANLIEKGLK